MRCVTLILDVKDHGSIACQLVAAPSAGMSPSVLRSCPWPTLSAEVLTSHWIACAMGMVVGDEFMESSTWLKVLPLLAYRSFASFADSAGGSVPPHPRERWRLQASRGFLCCWPVLGSEGICGEVFRWQEGRAVGVLPGWLVLLGPCHPLRLSKNLPTMARRRNVASTCCNMLFDSCFSQLPRFTRSACCLLPAPRGVHRSGMDCPVACAALPSPSRAADERNATKQTLPDQGVFRTEASPSALPPFCGQAGPSSAGIPAVRESSPQIPRRSRYLATEPTPPTNATTHGDSRDTLPSRTSNEKTRQNQTKQKPTNT